MFVIKRGWIIQIQHVICLANELVPKNIDIKYFFVGNVSTGKRTLNPTCAFKYANTTTTNLDQPPPATNLHQQPHNTKVSPLIQVEENNVLPINIVTHSSRSISNIQNVWAEMRKNHHTLIKDSIHKINWRLNQEKTFNKNKKEVPQNKPGARIQYSYGFSHNTIQFCEDDKSRRPWMHVGTRICYTAYNLCENVKSKI